MRSAGKYCVFLLLLKSVLSDSGTSNQVVLLDTTTVLGELDWKTFPVNGDLEFGCLDSPWRSTSETLKADGKLRVGLTENNSCYLNLAPLHGLGWPAIFNFSWVLCKQDALLPLPPPFPEDTCGPAQNCVAG
ncbi:hypothetical protein AMECASPLE_009851 [Ameca splendens]|uniref:Uncharacterized protein n=1 Tax=Ameca splendens TaxID=208324 RepID=A0ABV0YYE4_9TELE